jgi:hypothetical protein
MALTGYTNAPSNWLPQFKKTGFEQHLRWILENFTPPTQRSEGYPVST